MPRKGYRAVSVRTELYELSQKVLERYKLSLMLERIESLSDLWEAAFIEFLKNRYPNILKELEKS